MTDHILASLKAYAALIGSVLTAIIATTNAPSWVPIAAAVCTAIATWAIPAPGYVGPARKPKGSVGPKE